MTDLTIDSTVRLSSGHSMPLLGFGVFENYSAKGSVLEALKAGYRHVDSAQYYENEADVGEAVRESGLDRENIFITSKCTSKGSGRGYGPTLKGVDESLGKFGFEYLDLFLIHDPLGGKELRLETYRALLDAKRAGKIRTVGVSNYGVKHLEEIMSARLEPPAVNQIEVHPLCQQKPIVEYCKEHNIVVQAYCPMLRGDMKNPVIQELARKYDRDPAHILLRWSLQKGFVPLPKSATPSRIHSNTNIYDFELDEMDMQKLDSLDKGKDGAVSWNPVDVD